MIFSKEFRDQNTLNQWWRCESKWLL